MVLYVFIPQLLYLRLSDTLLISKHLSHVLIENFCACKCFYWSSNFWSICRFFSHRLLSSILFKNWILSFLLYWYFCPYRFTIYCNRTYLSLFAFIEDLIQNTTVKKKSHSLFLFASFTLLLSLPLSTLSLYPFNILIVIALFNFDHFLCSVLLPSISLSIIYNYLFAYSIVFQYIVWAGNSFYPE